ncbi:MAG: trypsin-like serine protease, partial [Flavisolibacter sp.]
MHVTVNKYLNARVGLPSTNAPCPVYHEPGTILEIDQLVSGDNIDGNSVWYHCKQDSFYYWSGGITEFDFSIDSIGLDENQMKTILGEAIKYYWNYWKLTIPGLTGVYPDENNKLVFQVSPENIPSSNIPAIINYRGISAETEVRQTSYAKPELINPGNSVSRITEMIECGTIGLKVARKEISGNIDYVLTNYHVAAFDLIANKQFSYRFPPDISNRQIMVPAQKFASDGQKFIGAFFEGRLSTFHDIALIKLNDGNDASNKVDDFMITDFINVLENSSQYNGKNAIMYGGASGKKSARIISVHSSQIFVYPNNHQMELVELIQIEKFSKGGDSGSPVLLNKKIIGIHVGSDDQFSYALPIKRILDFYNLK